MKAAIIIVGFIAVVASASHISLDRNVDALVKYAKLRGINRGALEDQVFALVECLRKIFREGGELTGGKVLDPFDAEHVDANVEIPNFVNVTGALDNVHVDGLSSFNLTSLKINIILTKVDYSLTFDHLKAKGLYDLVANLVDADPLFGKGPFDIQLNKITASGFIKLRLKNLTYLELAELKLLLTIGDMKFQIDGLMNDPELSSQINDFLNETLPELIKQNQELISNTVNSVAKDLLNPILSQLTLQDILDLIGGAGEGGLEC